MGKRLCGLVMGVCALLLLSGCGQAGADTRVAVLKIGQADAIVITQGSHAVLIDMGEQEDGEEILAYLKKQNIGSLDAVIVTHYDKDHIGGAPTVFSGIPVSAVYDAHYEPGAKPYKAYVEALAARGIPRHRVGRQLTLNIGGLTLTLMPTALETSEDNDNSIVIAMADGQHTYFFAGDAEEARIAELLETGLSAHDFIKMPHHGRYKPNLPALLEALSPTVAVITDSDKNPAEQETLDLLAAQGIAAYETRHGDILVISGEKGLTIEQ